MPDTISFDTLVYANKLKSVGFIEDQTEVQAEALAQIIDEQVATQKNILSPGQSINGHEKSLNLDIKEMTRSLSREFKEMELRLKHDLIERLGAIMIISITISVTLVKLL